MKDLVPFSIPFKGLKNGIHQYQYRIDQSFFQHFEDSPVSSSDIDLSVQLDKRPDFIVLQFDFKGTVKADCDRCLAPIDLPVVDSQRLMVKLAEGVSEDPDIVFVHPEASNINVSSYIYEFILLAMPMIKVYDCENDENPACNFEMLEYLKRGDEEEKKDASPNPIWDELKKLDNLN